MPRRPGARSTAYRPPTLRTRPPNTPKTDPRPTRPRPLTANPLPRGWAKLKTSIITRDQGLCQIGGSACTITATTADHIIPRAAGGSHLPTNLRASCQTCNLRRSRLAPKP